MSASPFQTPHSLVIELPASFSRELEEAAQEEESSPTDLLRRSFRMYQINKMQAKLEVMREALPATLYAEEDVVRLVKEVREEIYQEQNSK